MWKRFALAGVVIVLLSAATTATAALLELKDGIDRATPNPRIPGSGLDPVPTAGPQTFLLLGSDLRKADRKAGRKGNSDTMMLIHVDPNQEATTVLSVPRDLKVQIPGVGTAKVNAAYATGGPVLTVRVLKQVFPKIPINHVVDVGFGGFREIVDHVGCVYADIDRRYLNTNAFAYAEIDLKPGYQKLCGSNALDYVRFRHLDTDLVRSARQQDFLRDFKDQVGGKKLLSDYKSFLTIIGDNSSTDIRGVKTTLGILKLLAKSAGHPVRQVPFEADIGPSYVTASTAQLRDTQRRFLNGGSAAPDGARAGIVGKTDPGVTDGKSSGEDLAIALQPKTHFPVLFPGKLAAGSSYDEESRAYVIRDREHTVHRAYRLVVDTNELGGYYGIEGMTWKDPPIVGEPDETRTVKRHKLGLYYSGKTLRIVTYRTPRALYYVSNTLQLGLTNKQMIAIAASLRKLG